MINPFCLLLSGLYCVLAVIFCAFCKKHMTISSWRLIQMRATLKKKKRKPIGYFLCSSKQRALHLCLESIKVGGCNHTLEQDNIALVPGIFESLHQLSVFSCLKPSLRRLIIPQNTNTRELVNKLLKNNWNSHFHCPFGNFFASNFSSLWSCTVWTEYRISA